MQRLATTVAIAAWIGFLAVFSLEVTLDAVAPDILDAAAKASWPPAVAAQFDGVAPILSVLTPLVELSLAAACLSIVGLFARSLFLIHAPRRGDIIRGERVAAGGLAGVALLAGAAQATAVPLLPIDLEGGLVWLALALSIAALAFDRLVAIETSEERRDDADFQASFATLAETMARQARLYPLPDAATFKTRRPDLRSVPDPFSGKDERP